MDLYANFRSGEVGFSEGVSGFDDTVNGDKGYCVGGGDSGVVGCEVSFLDFRADVAIHEETDKGLLILAERGNARIMEVNGRHD